MMDSSMAVAISVLPELGSARRCPALIVLSSSGAVGKGVKVLALAGPHPAGLGLVFPAAVA
jgi:hypothetical protein